MAKGEKGKSGIQIEKINLLFNPPFCILTYAKSLRLSYVWLVCIEDVSKAKMTFETSSFKMNRANGSVKNVSVPSERIIL